MHEHICSEQHLLNLRRPLDSGRDFNICTDTWGPITFNHFTGKWHDSPQLQLQDQQQEQQQQQREEPAPALQQPQLPQPQPPQRLSGGLGCLKCFLFLFYNVV